MLILTRKVGQSVVVADDIVITVLGIEGDRIRLGLSAPPAVRILRQELSDAMRDANRVAAITEDYQPLAALLRPVKPISTGGNKATSGESVEQAPDRDEG